MLATNPLIPVSCEVDWTCLSSTLFSLIMGGCIILLKSHRHQGIPLPLKGVHGLQLYLCRWYVSKYHRHGWQDPRLPNIAQSIILLACLLPTVPGIPHGNQCTPTQLST